MIPWQIYCDYLEDKGFDCRLFRTLEPSKFTVSTFAGCPVRFANDYSYGCGYSYGWYSGNGKGGYINGSGSGTTSGDGNNSPYGEMNNMFINYADKQTMVQ